MSREKASPITQALLNWYDAHRRSLPWRDIGNPYATWVSEIMLQQTRVETVIPYYRRFMEDYPDVMALAAAPEDEVLKHWEDSATSACASSRQTRLQKYGFFYSPQAS